LQIDVVNFVFKQLWRRD